MELMTTKEVATLLRLTTARVSQLCAEGKFKAYRTQGDSGHWRIERSSVLRVLPPEQPSFPETQALVHPDTSIFERIKAKVRQA